MGLGSWGWVRWELGIGKVEVMEGKGLKRGTTRTSTTHEASHQFKARDDTTRHRSDSDTTTPRVWKRRSWGWGVGWRVGGLGRDELDGDGKGGKWERRRMVGGNDGWRGFG